jgi:hypothetical protein
MKSRLLGLLVVALFCWGIGCSRITDETSDPEATPTENAVEAHAQVPAPAATQSPISPFAYMQSEPKDKGPQISTDGPADRASRKPPAELVAKQKQYLEAWRTRKREWDAAGMSAEAQQVELARLKQSILEK